MATHHELSVSAGDAHPLAAITMNSLVTYVEEPGGEPRSVTLVRPAEASAVAGRISVFSPIGRALLGRRPGAVVALGSPAAGALKVRILSSEPGPS
jgi:regulator of nucleoside diphosphate kinase